MDALDLIEFCHKHISAPIQTSYHKYCRHHHLSFDREAGQVKLREEVNDIFRRNGLAYNLEQDGKVIRLGPPVLRDAINKDLPKTDDDEFNSLLTTAVDKFNSPDPKVRKEALDKLWDAWERLKTTFSSDKRASAEALLDKATKEHTLREALENEAKELTRIGNAFQIRHFEKDKAPITESEHVDYLFHRMFSLILLLVKALKSVAPK